MKIFTVFYWGNYSDYLRQKEEERRSQTAEYEQFVAERDRLERAAEVIFPSSRHVEAINQVSILCFKISSIV